MAQRVDGSTLLANELDICQTLLDRVSDRTPDFIELRNQHTIPILVYGTLKMGNFFHDALKGCPYLGEAVTPTEAFFMQETSGFPVAFHIGTANDPRMKRRGKLHGEVYVVDPKVILRLDEIEDNGRMYTRKKVIVKLLDQPSDVPAKQKFLKVWIYFGVDRFWSSDQMALFSVTPKESSSGRVYSWEPRRPQRGGSSQYIAEAYGPDQRLDDQIPF